MKIELAQYDGEYIVHIPGKPSEDFKETLGQVFEAYQEFLDSENLQVDDEVRVRLYLSDLANQYGELCEFIAENKFEDRNIITIGQAPTSLSKVSLEAYLIRNTANTDLSVKGRVSDNVFKFSHGEYETLFIRNKSNPNLERDEQAKDLLNCLSRDVGFNQGDVEKDLHRTWIYIRDIDMNYQVLADERKKYFDTINMTPETHYVASTGIEALNEKANCLYYMDSVVVKGLTQGQVKYLSSPENICPTYAYCSDRSYGKVGQNVTFERGTQISYGDRNHYYISGTASIDRDGNILYLRDVLRQAQRALDNVAALLDDGGATLEDALQFIVYLRDVSDHEKVHSFLRSKITKDIPIVMVKGNVCNASWLVEIECYAVCHSVDRDFSAYVN